MMAERQVDELIYKLSKDKLVVSLLQNACNSNSHSWDALISIHLGPSA